MFVYFLKKYRDPDRKQEHFRVNLSRDNSKNGDLNFIDILDVKQRDSLYKSKDYLWGYRYSATRTGTEFESDQNLIVTFLQ